MSVKRRTLWFAGLCLAAAGCQSGPLAWGPAPQRGVALGRPIPAQGMTTAANGETTSPQAMRSVAPHAWLRWPGPQRPATQPAPAQPALAQGVPASQTITAHAAPTYPAVAQSVPQPAGGDSLFLKAGAEVEWAVQNSQQLPGQITNGRTFVGPDGSIVLGPYGTCHVGGLSLAQATMAVERHLSPYINQPNVRLTTAMPATAVPNEVLWRSASNSAPAYITPHTMPVMHQTVHRPNYAMP